MTDPGKHTVDLAAIARAAPREATRSRMRTELSPVDLSTVQEKVYQSLRLALLKGQLFPGEQVSIRSLAKALGTSAMPVREAVKRLVAEKGLEQSSDRLLRVAPYVASVHEEYIRIRIQVEGFATEKACLSNDPSLIDRLKRHNKTMLEALHADDLESALATNQAFHFEIYKAAAYPQLLDIISNLWLRTGPILATSRYDKDFFHKVFDIGYRVHNEGSAHVDTPILQIGKCQRSAPCIDSTETVVIRSVPAGRTAVVSRGITTPLASVLDASKWGPLKTAL
jgi:DNA-binding GntR family transcriptional regulator